MPEAKQVMTWEELTKERNPFLFYAKHMPTLTGDDGRHGKAQCKVPKAPENLCRLADSHGECLTSDAHVALQTLGKLIEGYTTYDSPTYEDDPMQALAGVGTLIRLLSDALEVGRDIKFHAAEGIYCHCAITEAELSI